MVNLDELLRIAGAVILVDMPNLEFIWPDNLPKRWSWSTKTAPPRWGDITCWRTSWRGQRPYPEMPPIVDDVAEVLAVMTALSQVAVLSNPPPRVVVGKTAVAACR
jgi:hypothetical protein